MPRSRMSALASRAMARIGLVRLRRWNWRRSSGSTAELRHGKRFAGNPGESVTSMTSDPRVNRRSIWRVGPKSTWTTVVPVVFIILSLISIVTLPIVVRNKTRRMRNEISTVAEPARRAANEIQIDLSAELDKIIAYQFTGQGQYRAEYFR